MTYAHTVFTWYNYVASLIDDHCKKARLVCQCWMSSFDWLWHWHRSALISKLVASTVSMRRQKKWCCNHVICQARSIVAATVTSHAHMSHHSHEVITNSFVCLQPSLFPLLPSLPLLSFTYIPRSCCFSCFTPPYLPPPSILAAPSFLLTLTPSMSFHCSLPPLLVPSPYHPFSLPIPPTALSSSLAPFSSSTCPLHLLYMYLLSPSSFLHNSFPHLSLFPLNSPSLSPYFSHHPTPSFLSSIPFAVLVSPFPSTHYPFHFPLPWSVLIPSSSHFVFAIKHP